MNAPIATTPQVPIVLLAAGAGERFGGIKQLAPIDGEPMLRRVARGVFPLDTPLIVVTGAHAPQVETALAGLPVVIERHAGWADGMGSSLAAGIRRLIADFPGATGALLCLADQPLLDIELLRRMLVRHRAAAAAILVTSQRNVDGPPVLFPRDCFETLANWSGAHGARALLKREAHRVERFAASGMIDVDTPADLARVRETLARDRVI
ncbi:MAG: nucleotidyltransferase family protein [Proteobacteria bacterium]|nr:nucleotidyltransferase family protein [Pseudomonadota bacterium]